MHRVKKERETWRVKQQQQDENLVGFEDKTLFITVAEMRINDGMKNVKETTGKKMSYMS